MQDQNESKNIESENVISTVTAQKAPSDDISEKKKKPSKVKEIFEWVEMIVISFCAVVLIFTFVARPAVVVGDSMLNTLIDGETLIISPLDDEYEYKDIVVFQLPDNLGTGQHEDAIVKRVIATEGQWVDIDLGTWKVYVADSEEGLDTAEPLDESYVNYSPGKSLAASVNFPLQVPEGCLFVMGDNRNGSKDSRHPEIGLVDKREVLGKVFFLFVPGTNEGEVPQDFSRIGVVN